MELLGCYRAVILSSIHWIEIANTWGNPLASLSFLVVSFHLQDLHLFVFGGMKPVRQSNEISSSIGVALARVVFSRNKTSAAWFFLLARGKKSNSDSDNPMCQHASPTVHSIKLMVIVHCLVRTINLNPSKKDQCYHTGQFTAGHLQCDLPCERSASFKKRDQYPWFIRSIWQLLQNDKSNLLIERVLIYCIRAPQTWECKPRGSTNLNLSVSKVFILSMANPSRSAAAFHESFYSAARQQEESLAHIDGGRCKAIKRIRVPSL